VRRESGKTLLQRRGELIERSFATATKRVACGAANYDDERTF
jgi:hypothetical protein